MLKINIDKDLLEKIIRQVLEEQKCCSKVLSFNPAEFRFSENNRLDTKNPKDKVYTLDLLTLEQSRNLGFGLMEITDSTFPWTLTYDEIDIVLEGELKIICNGVCKTAKKGEAIYIPKGSEIEFSADNYAKFYYVTYPADWQNSSK